ncbi:hypothetical protein E1A91_D10G252700v1 [Gossypium mustelinum]|uniref:Uncharacterized protein n=2 Tax=Gossypium TaxID=3633 RepID=A0A5D2TD78_GOSMU|nr:hypothetical protein ES332_D10G269100v1 [Gossypium tomentosum]TYI62555.1 hypothetical protein E1A91_D10G252700v1 [Gossypium mustelinum]TYI62556.1 hypothetical protein E1A91_D10G252700v1 [Gossypium mustelinum]TYI62557.1 hypothetical protein E1A91_D10G252700v1 [Gossypium mustelinum]TYI62558.1 hypothetical protein E1A91_D10G252700v1 [Gossypium mustelinum]
MGTLPTCSNHGLGASQPAASNEEIKTMEAKIERLQKKLESLMMPLQGQHRKPLECFRNRLKKQSLVSYISTKSR